MTLVLNGNKSYRVQATLFYFETPRRSALVKSSTSQTDLLRDKTSTLITYIAFPNQCFMLSGQMLTYLASKQNCIIYE